MTKQVILNVMRKQIIEKGEYNRMKLNNTEFKSKFYNMLSAININQYESIDLLMRVIGRKPKEVLQQMLLIINLW